MLTAWNHVDSLIKTTTLTCTLSFIVWRFLRTPRRPLDSVISEISCSIAVHFLSVSRTRAASGLRCDVRVLRVQVSSWVLSLCQVTCASLGRTSCGAAVSHFFYPILFGLGLPNLSLVSTGFTCSQFVFHLHNQALLYSHTDKYKENIYLHKVYRRFRHLIQILCFFLAFFLGMWRLNVLNEVFNSL